MTDRLSTAIVGASATPAASCCGFCSGIRASTSGRSPASGSTGSSCTSLIRTCERRTDAEVRAIGGARARGRAVPVPAARQRDGAHRPVRRIWPIASSISAPTSGSAGLTTTSAGTGSRTPVPTWLERFVYGLPELQRREIAARDATSAASAATPRRPRWRCGRWPPPASSIPRAASCARSRSGAARAAPRRAMRRITPSAPASCAASRRPVIATPPKCCRRCGCCGVETDVHLSATAVDNVRGVLATAHVFVKPGVAETRPVEGVSRGLRQRAVRAHRQGARGPVSLSRAEDSVRQQLRRRRLRARCSSRAGRRDVRDRQPDERRRRHRAAVR